MFADRGARGSLCMTQAVAAAHSRLTAWLSPYKVLCCFTSVWRSESETAGIAVGLYQIAEPPRAEAVIKAMPRLRHHWGGNTSSAAISAIAQAENEAKDASSSEDDENLRTQEVDLYGSIRALLEERLLVQARAQRSRSIGRNGRLSTAKGPKSSQAAQRTADGKGVAEVEDEGNVEELGEFIEVRISNISGAFL